MSVLRLIISWLSVGFICTLIGIISDYLLYKQKPGRKFIDYAFPILLGWISIFILLKSIFSKIKIKLKK